MTQGKCVYSEEGKEKGANDSGGHGRQKVETVGQRNLFMRKRRGLQLLVEG